MLLYVTSAWKIYQSTTAGRLRSNNCQEFWFPPLFFEANPSSKLKALMRQVPKQKQVKLQYFRLYQIEKTTRQKQLLTQSYNFNSRRANCERYTKLKLLLELFLMIIYHTWIQEQIWNLICCRYFNHWTILITILNTSSNLRALMWQVQKQHQVKPEYFELYHFEKNIRHTTKTKAILQY